MYQRSICFNNSVFVSLNIKKETETVNATQRKIEAHI